MTINVGITILLLLLVVLPVAAYLVTKMGTYGYLRAKYKFWQEQDQNRNCNGKGDNYYE